MLAVARRIRPEIEWHHGDVADLPFPDASFDVALCQAALMYVPDRVNALTEMVRVVRPTEARRAWARCGWARSTSSSRRLCLVLALHGGNIEALPRRRLDRDRFSVVENLDRPRFTCAPHDRVPGAQHGVATATISRDSYSASQGDEVVVRPSLLSHDRASTTAKPADKLPALLVSLRASINASSLWHRQVEDLHRVRSCQACCASCTIWSSFAPMPSGCPASSLPGSGRPAAGSASSRSRRSSSAVPSGAGTSSA